MSKKICGKRWGIKPYVLHWISVAVINLSSSRRRTHISILNEVQKKIVSNLKITLDIYWSYQTCPLPWWLEIETKSHIPILSEIQRFSGKIKSTHQIILEIMSNIPLLDLYIPQERDGQFDFASEVSLFIIKVKFRQDL